MLFFVFLSLAAIATDLPVDGDETVRSGPGCPSQSGARVIALRPARLRGTHRRDSVFVDLNHEASRVRAAREALEAFRSAENDRVRVAARLDRVALLDLCVEECVEAVPASPERVDLSHGASIASEASPNLFDNDAVNAGIVAI